MIPELGIAGTPVIDPESGTIYLIAFTKESGSRYVYRLHAIDVTSGAERPQSRGDSAARFRANGSQAADGAAALERSCLLVVVGSCDEGDYHGWVMAHDATTLKLAGFFNASPSDSGASFWNGGAGPAADDQGNIYVVSANGDFDGDAGLAEYDESVLRLARAPGLLPSGRTDSVHSIQ